MGEHVLMWKQAVPSTTSEAKTYDILAKGRALLTRLSGNADDIRFRHRVSDEEAKIGGPLGKTIAVRYIQLWAKFNQSEVILPPETKGLVMQYRQDSYNRTINEAAAKALADQRKEMEKKVKDAQAQKFDPVRDDPGMVTVPAHQVPLDKMLISDEELARVAKTPSGVSIWNGNPTTDDEVK